MLYSSKYTFTVSSWGEQEKDCIVNIFKESKIYYKIEHSFLNPLEMKLQLIADKQTIEMIELKGLKYLSQITKIENFIKVSSPIDETLLVDQSFFIVDECAFSLIYKSTILEKPLSEAVKMLHSNKIGLVKNINGYYLCANSTKSQSIKKVKNILQKECQTLPLLVKNIITAEKFLSLSKKEKELINSNIKPYIKAKRRNIHRLEKVKNIPLQSISHTNIYEVKLPKNSLEEYIVTNTNLPLIFQQVHNYQDLYDKVDFILEFEKDFFDFEDSVMQIIYGKPQVIKAGFGLYPSVKEKLLSTDCKYPLPYHHIKNSNFTQAILCEASSDELKVLLFENDTLKLLYKLDKSPKKYFDEISDKVCADFSKLSQQYCDNVYEVCHEKSYDFSIVKSIITIDTSKDISKNEICSTLINTFRDIVQEIYHDKELPFVLCGELFENKNLTENIIEYFDDNDIKYHISSEIPINESAVDFEKTLDFYPEK